MYFVYILKSEKDSEYYTGLTNNLDRRISEHNSGKVKSTSFRKPFILVYSEEVNDRKQARMREKWLKSGEGREFRKQLLNIPR